MNFMLQLADLLSVVKSVQCVLILNECISCHPSNPFESRFHIAKLINLFYLYSFLCFIR